MSTNQYLFLQRLLDAKLSEDGCSTELLSVIKTVLAGCKKISNILSSGDFSYIPLDSFGVQQVNEKEPLNTISNNIRKISKMIKFVPYFSAPMTPLR